jgi:hypothetical protein
MTSSHKPIKIIARKQRENCADETAPFEKTARQMERELVNTVKSWIDARRSGMEEFAASNPASRLLQLRDNL